MKNSIEKLAEEPMINPKEMAKEIVNALNRIATAIENSNLPITTNETDTQIRTLLEGNTIKVKPKRNS